MLKVFLPSTTHLLLVPHLPHLPHPTPLQWVSTAEDKHTLLSGYDMKEFRKSYPVPAVGSSLSSLRLSFLQPPVRKGVLVEAV